jgi:hypothetical protein
MAGPYQRPDIKGQLSLQPVDRIEDAVPCLSAGHVAVRLLSSVMLAILRLRKLPDRALNGMKSTGTGRDQ